MMILTHIAAVIAGAALMFAILWFWSDLMNFLYADAV